MPTAPPRPTAKHLRRPRYTPRGHSKLIDPRQRYPTCVFCKNGRVVTRDRGRPAARLCSVPTGAGCPTIEGECSCGERSPCVHVAAGGNDLRPRSRVRPGRPDDRPHRHGSQHRQRSFSTAAGESGFCSEGAPLRQSLCYLIEPDAVRGLQLSRVGNPDLGGQQTPPIWSLPFRSANSRRE